MASAHQGPTAAAPLEVSAVLDVILGCGARLFAADSSSLMLVVPGEELEVAAAPTRPETRGQRVPFGQGVAGKVAQNRRPELVTGRVGIRRKPVHSAMCLPLVHDGHLFGVLNLNARAASSFTSHDLTAAGAFADHAADALAAARGYEDERRKGTGFPGHHLQAMLGHLSAAASVDFVEPRPLEAVNAAAVARALAGDEERAGRPTAVRGPASVSVTARKGDLRRALLELIDNGHRHGAAPVRVLFDGDGNRHAVLTVADGGPGVPAAEGEAVFAPFHRLERDAGHGDRPDGDGLGLGLTIARRLIESMGGEITWVADASAGAGVRVRLPLATR